ncbi:hypothetical protein ACHQM5_000211 [Ranunculus cassubicifolius]
MRVLVIICSLVVLICAYFIAMLSNSHPRISITPPPPRCYPKRITLSNLVPFPLRRTCNPRFWNRHSFGSDFVFGTASSAYQFEGAYNEDGKGASIWDTFTHEHPDRIADGSNGDVAIDQYHRYKEDIKLMKDMGMDAYRFSISWSRVLPNGKLSGGVNKEGLNYYHRLIDEIISKNMKPFVTIFHWDVPQHLDFEYGGFLSKKIVPHFQDYAELLFQNFGKRVKHWITLNEPWTFSNYGYCLGLHAPGRCSYPDGNCTYGDSSREPYIVTHHQLLAHAAAVDVYRRKYKDQNGVIGMTNICNWMIPYSDSKNDRDAARRALDFMCGWFMDPITYGDYPPSMRLNARYLPYFSDDDKKLLKGSYDFIGLNYYTTNWAKDIPHKGWDTKGSYTTDSGAELTKKNGLIFWRDKLLTVSSWLYVYPEGLKELLVYIKQHYRDPTIYITENGVAEPYTNATTSSLTAALEDEFRKKYHCHHLQLLQDAIQYYCVDVRGYFAWAFSDNMEWNAGYTVGFGLNYVDFNTLQRYHKRSAIWFKDFLK